MKRLFRNLTGAMSTAPLLLMSGCFGCSPGSDTGPSGSGGGGGITDRGTGGSTVFVLPPDTTPWSETIAEYRCEHVKVVEDCRDGYCRIPAGCFIKGSPDTEPSHGVFTEILRPVVLTRAFLMQQTEVTQRDWLELIPNNPSGPNLENPSTEAGTYNECVAPDCPVGHVNWWEAAEYANRLSRKEGRQECFVLKNCVGTPGIRPDAGEVFVCDEDYELATPSVYDCSGYRFPTDAEFEYAARAGTRTAFYSGDLPAEYARECDRLLPALDAVAWYCANSGNASHPVGQKLPNRWGLFDLLGNMNEWGHNRSKMKDPGALPWIDPFGQTGNGLDGGDHQSQSGDFRLEPSLARVAGGESIPDEVKGAGLGFRLVRTLAEGESW